MSITDRWGRLVTVTSADGQDRYAADGLSVACPAGTPPEHALAALEAMAPPDQVGTGPRTLTPLQFRDRFTAAEELAITQATTVNLQIRVWMDRLNAATEVGLDDPRTILGVQALALAGLIDARRVTEILA